MSKLTPQFCFEKNLVYRPYREAKQKELIRVRLLRSVTFSPCSLLMNVPIPYYRTRYLYHHRRHHHGALIEHHVYMQNVDYDNNSNKHFDI
jgi:hypothetical protein